MPNPVLEKGGFLLGYHAERCNWWKVFWYKTTTLVKMENSITLRAFVASSIKSSQDSVAVPTGIFSPLHYRLLLTSSQKPAKESQLFVDQHLLIQLKNLLCPSIHLPLHPPSRSTLSTFLTSKITWETAKYWQLFLYGTCHWWPCCWSTWW